MARVGGSPPVPGRRARRVAGQRPVAGRPAAEESVTPYAPPRRTVDRPAEPVAPATPAPTGPGWRERLAGLRARLPRPAAGGRPDARPDGGARWRGPVALALVAVIVAGATLTGLYLQGYLHARAVANARDDALQAAKIGVPLFASYNYKTFDADVAKAERYLTPAYRKTYADYQAKAVKATAVKYHATVTAELAAGSAAGGAGVVSGGTSTVQIMVFVNQTETNTKVSAPRLSQSRLLVEMHKVGGRWLIAQVLAV